MSKLNVTLASPSFVIDAEKLPELLLLVNAEITVSPVEEVEPEKPVRKSRRTANKAKDKPEVKEATEETKPEVTEETKPDVIDGDAPTYETVLDAFTQLIDDDYDGAVELLGEFGVAKFSVLEESQYAAFSAKVAELLAKK